MGWPARLPSAPAAALYVIQTSPPWYERLRYPLHYSAIVREQARDKKLDPALLAAVIYQESKFDSDARSSSGAVGLMQLRPETAKGIALRTGGTAFRVSDLTDPAINIRYGSWYLQNLFAKYHDERLVLAAYNAGRATSTAGSRQGRRSSSPRRAPTSSGSHG